MSLPLVVHVEADTEIEEAAVWYEERRPGLGLEFIGAIDRVALDIEETPHRFPVWKPPWRRAVLPRFPFLVFFEVEENQIALMAVAHARRRPGYWMARKPPHRSR